MPRALAEDLSMTSVPVAATAIIFRLGSCASVASRSGTLLMMAIVASRRRSTI